MPPRGATAYIVASTTAASVSTSHVETMRGRFCAAELAVWVSTLAAGLAITRNLDGLIVDIQTGGGRRLETQLRPVALRGDRAARHADAAALRIREFDERLVIAAERERHAVCIALEIAHEAVGLRDVGHGVRRCGRGLRGGRRCGRCHRGLRCSR